MALMWWNPFTIERVTLRTPLAPDACIVRIRANIYSPWSGSDPSLPFGGMARRNHFTLRKNTPHFGNAFRPLCYGAIRSDTVHETTINIRLALALPARIWWAILLMGFVVAFLLSFLGAAGIVEIDPALSNPFNVLVAAITAGIMFYPFYLITFWLSQGERAFLIDALQTILHASLSQ